MQQTTTHRIIEGDSRRMGVLADESVHLIITSPPYWQLKDYGRSEQIGFDDSYEEYINHLNMVWMECVRVLHKGCRLCINVGDQFARAAVYGRYKVIPIHAEIIRFLETMGMDFMGKIIWQKTTTMHASGGGAVMGSFPFPRNGILKLDYEYILVFKKQGEAPKPTTEQKEASKLCTEEWNTYFSGHWNFPGVKQDKHLAMFPEELPRRLIQMYSFAAETVLDPFAGSGTTAKAARNTERNSISYEINPDFIPLIEERIGGQTLLSDVRVVIERDKDRVESDALFGKLPYHYTDPHALDKQADPEAHAVGSVISAQTEKPMKFYRVKSVLSPEQIVLNDNTFVRLLGIRKDPRRESEAIEFLYKTFAGKRVFLKADSGFPYNAEEEIYTGYVYLDNHMFVNAHLLKRGLAFADEVSEYTNRAKFIKLRAAAQSEENDHGERVDTKQCGQHIPIQQLA
ncbi:MAG: site-specific DNA-methyltransferase [Oscillospiraceae bacterium]|jgi:site-specific DNA-methyltransferase (adenine-specific)|nr:site-specific DNA-methyltransferase [Oscillospiraceae bacterium]